jgi:hypothetical protein
MVLARPISEHDFAYLGNVAFAVSFSARSDNLVQIV